VSERVRKLAHQVVREGAPPLEKARGIESYLRTAFTYDLGSPSGKSPDPLDDFLFVSRRGHCEFYSTAMVVLLRELKVPARNVTGFIGGSYNRFGHYYAVRQGDAHSWVEVFVPERGWQTFDPTPPAEAAPRSELSGVLAFVRDIIEATGQRWDRYVVGYDLRQQVYLFHSLSRYGSLHVSPALAQIKPFAFAMIGASGVVVVYVIWRRRRRGRQRVATTLDRVTRERMIATSMYEQLEAAMNAQGIPRGASTPPLRHALSLQRMGHPLAEEVLDLTQFYLDARFGGIAVTERERRDFEGRVKRVRTVRPLPRTHAGV
jgi:hypothetical protein